MTVDERLACLLQRTESLHASTQELHATAGVGPNDLLPNFVDINKGMTTDANGQFSDHPFGECGSVPIVRATDTQNIRIVDPKNARTFYVRTNNWSYTGTYPRKGLITNGVDVTITQ